MSPSRWFVKIGLFVKVICCMFDHFFICHIDGKYRSATAPFVWIKSSIKFCDVAFMYFEPRERNSFFSSHFFLNGDCFMIILSHDYVVVLKIWWAAHVIWGKKKSSNHCLLINLFMKFKKPPLSKWTQILKACYHLKQDVLQRNVFRTDQKKNQLQQLINWMFGASRRKTRCCGKRYFCTASFQRSPKN